MTSPMRDNNIHVTLILPNAKQKISVHTPDFSPVTAARLRIT